MTYYVKKREDDRRRLYNWEFTPRPQEGDLRDFNKLISKLEIGESAEGLKKFHVYATGWSKIGNTSMIGTSDIEKITKNECDFIAFTTLGNYVLAFGEQK